MTRNAVRRAGVPVATNSAAEQTGAMNTMSFRWAYYAAPGALIVMLLLPLTRYLAIGCCIAAAIILGLRVVAWWDPDDPREDDKPGDQGPRK